MNALKPVVPLLLLALLLPVYAPRSSPAIAAKAVQMQHASMVLDWYPNSDHGGLFTAIQRGYFARRHLSMRAYVPSDTSAQISLVAAGRADFGISYETDLLLARARGIPVRSVMCIMQHPLNTIMSLKSSRIARPRDLQGHSIGIAGSPSDIPIIATLVKRDGGSMSRVHVVNVSSALLPALLSRKIDAVMDVYWTWEAILARDKGYPVNVLRFERWGVPNYCELVLISSEKLIAANPVLVRATVNALQEGYAYAEAHPPAAWNALHAKDATLKRPVVLKSLQLLKPIVTAAPTIGYQTPSQWRHYAQWLWHNHVISRPVSAGAAYTNRFLISGSR